MKTLFRKYFEEGMDISQTEIIISAAMECGIDESNVLEALNNPTYLLEVMQKVDHTQNVLHVIGVPFFMIYKTGGGRPITFSGAQPPDIIAEALQMAL